MSILFQSLGFAGDFNQKGCTDYGKSRSNTGVAFHSGVRAKQIDVPNDARDLWIRFDIWMSDKLNTRWRVYQEQNGYTDGITEAGGTNVNIWSSNNKNNESKLATAKKDEMSGLHSYVLHMKSDKTNGIVEYWRDGQKIDGVTGNCNNGLSFDCLYLQTDGFGSQFSNVIVAPTPLTCNDQADRGNILDLQALTKNADWDKDAFAVKRSNGNGGDYMLYGDVNEDNYCSMASGRSAYFKLAGQGAIEKFRAYFRDPLSYSGLLYCSDDDKNYVKVSDFSCSNTYYVDIDARNQQHTYWRIDVAKVTGSDGFDRVAIYGAQQPATHRDAGEKVNVTINADISRTIKTEEKSELFDKSRAVWTYHNDGHKAGMPDYVQEVVADAEHSHTGTGIYQTSTQDDNMFGMPADTQDFWAEFDLYYDGSKIKAYDSDNTGYSLTGTAEVWLNNSSRKTYPVNSDGLHHYILHMATSDAGFTEQMWMDGTQVVDYSDTTPYRAGYFGKWSIRSGDSDEVLSNIDIYVMDAESVQYGWHAPVISGNGTMGESDFAVTSNFAGDGAWKVFVPGATEYINKFNENCTFDVWTKQPVILQKVTLSSSDGYLPSEGKIYGSDNGTDWTPIGGWGDSDDHKSVETNVSADRGWNYFRFESLGRCSAHPSNNADITFIKLLGVESSASGIAASIAEDILRQICVNGKANADITRQITAGWQSVLDADLIRAARVQITTNADIERIAGLPGNADADIERNVGYGQPVEVDIFRQVWRHVNTRAAMQRVIEGHANTRADISRCLQSIPNEDWKPERSYEVGMHSISGGRYAWYSEGKGKDFIEPGVPNQYAEIPGKGITIWGPTDEHVYPQDYMYVRMPKCYNVFMAFDVFLPNDNYADSTIAIKLCYSDNDAYGNLQIHDDNELFFSRKNDGLFYPCAMNGSEKLQQGLEAGKKHSIVLMFCLAPQNEDVSIIRMWGDGEKILEAIPYRFLAFDGFDRVRFECYSDRAQSSEQAEQYESNVPALSNIVITNVFGNIGDAHGDLSRDVNCNGHVITRADVFRGAYMGMTTKADIARRTQCQVDTKVDVQRDIYGGTIHANADILLEAVRKEAAYADILSRAPHDTTFYPSNRHTNPFHPEALIRKDGVQSIGITLSAMTLADSRGVFSILSTNTPSKRPARKEDCRVYPACMMWTKSCTGP